MGTKVFKIKRNDTLPALKLSVTTSGNLGEKIGYNMSGVSAVTFTMVGTDCNETKVFQQTAQMICQSGGTIQYNWQDGDTDTAGKYLGEFTLNYTDGNKMSVPPMGGIAIEILKDLNAFD